jgi:hypothetical protein
MPDISLCANSSTCPLARTCYRAEESGTKPSGERQSWMFCEWRETNGGGACCAAYDHVASAISEEVTQ